MLAETQPFCVVHLRSLWCVRFPKRENSTLAHHTAAVLSFALSPGSGTTARSTGRPRPVEVSTGLVYKGPGLLEDIQTGLKS